MNTSTVIMYLQETSEGKLYGRYDPIWTDGNRHMDCGKVWFPHHDCGPIQKGYAVCELVREMDRYGFFIGENVNVRCPNAAQTLSIIERCPELNLGSCKTSFLVDGENSAILFLNSKDKPIMAFGVVDINGKAFSIKTPEMIQTASREDSSYLISSAIKQNLDITYTEFLSRYSYSMNTTETTIDEMIGYASVYNASDSVIRAITNGIVKIDRYSDVGELICAHFSNIWAIVSKGYVVDELDELQEFINAVNADTARRIQSSVARGRVSLDQARSLNYRNLLVAY